MSPHPHTDRTFAEVAKRYQVRLVGRRTFETVHSRDNGANDGDTALHKAASIGTIQDIHDLLRLGAEINAPGDMGDTPLHAAARYGHAEAVDILMDAGANIAIRNEFGDTPIDAAEKNGHEELALEMRRSAKAGGLRP